MVIRISWHKFNEYERAEDENANLRSSKNHVIENEGAFIYKLSSFLYEIYIWYKKI